MKNPSKELCQLTGLVSEINFIEPGNFIKLQYLKIDLPNWLGFRNMIDFASMGTSPEDFIRHICCNIKNPDFGGISGSGIRGRVIMAIKNAKWAEVK